MLAAIGKLVPRFGTDDGWPTLAYEWQVMQDDVWNEASTIGFDRIVGTPVAVVKSVQCETAFFSEVLLKLARNIVRFGHLIPGCLAGVDTFDSPSNSATSEGMCHWPTI
jgi:hypothetical protein